MFAGFGLRQPRAFADADRHTQRVRFLRRAIVVVCVSATGLIGFVSVFDPLHRLKMGLSVGSVGISGTRVTMNDPKLSGTRRDGLAYEVKAATATQDTTVPSKLDLTGVDLRLGQADGSTTRITALNGRYDTDAEKLDLVGTVRFRNEGHYDMAFEAAVMNLRGGEISTDRPVTVTIPGGRIEGDSVVFSEQTRLAVFDGNVRSVFSQDGEPALAEAIPPKALPPKALSSEAAPSRAETPQGTSQGTSQVTPEAAQRPARPVRDVTR